MKISWYGQSLMRISSRIKRKKVRVTFYPYTKKDTGLKPPKIRSEILLCNEANHNLKVAKGKDFVIDNPGEYEVQGVFIQGIPTFEFKKKKGKKKKQKVYDKNIIYKVNLKGINFCHLGEIKQKELTDEQLDQIGIVDILMIPVGGNTTINAEEATEIIGQIDPAIVVPMHYKVPKLKTDLDPVDKFLKLRQAKKVKPVKEKKIYKKDIDYEKSQTVVLKKK